MSTLATATLHIFGFFLLQLHFVSFSLSFFFPEILVVSFYFIYIYIYIYIVFETYYRIAFLYLIFMWKWEIVQDKTYTTPQFTFICLSFGVAVLPSHFLCYLAFLLIALHLTSFSCIFDHFVFPFKKQTFIYLI